MAQTESASQSCSAAVLLGYGFKDGVGVGLGMPGGYTLPVNVYLGGTFVYHLGKSVPGGTVNVFYLGFEEGTTSPRARHRAALPGHPGPA